MTTDNQSRQDILDQEHLRLLSIFYYVRAALNAFIACIPIIHMIIGIVMIMALNHVTTKPGEPSPAFIGWIFLVGGIAVFVLGWVFAILQFMVGRYISRRQHRIFCLVMAGVSCLAIPYGTLAGVMTFIVLGRDSVQALFASNQVFDAT